MEEAAGEADVSRRTLFNYPSKVDAVRRPTSPPAPRAADRDVLRRWPARVPGGGPRRAGDRPQGVRPRHRARSQGNAAVHMSGSASSTSASRPWPPAHRDDRAPDARPRRHRGAARGAPARGGLRHRHRRLRRRAHSDQTVTADHFRDHLRLAADLLHRDKPTHSPRSTTTMATLLQRLGVTATGAGPHFLAAWLLVFVAVGAVAAGFSTTDRELHDPGHPYEKAADLQGELFPGSERLRRGQHQRRRPGAGGRDPRPAGVPPGDPGAHRGPRRAAAARGPADRRPGQDRRAADRRHRGRGAGSVEQAEANAAAISPLSEDGRTGIITFEWDIDSLRPRGQTSRLGT